MAVQEMHSDFRDTIFERDLTPGGERSIRQKCRLPKLSGAKLRIAAGMEHYLTEVVANDATPDRVPAESETVQYRDETPSGASAGIVRSAW